MEEKRPGEYFPVFEENGETYIMNSKDMCMIDHVGELMEAGLDSLKLEGRAKSAYYAAIVTGAYRHAIDAAAAGQPLDPVWRDEVEHISHRHYSTGFFYGSGAVTQDAGHPRLAVAGGVQSCTPQGLATALCAISLPRGTPLSWWALTCVLWPSRPLSWPMPRGRRCRNPGTLR